MSVCQTRTKSRVFDKWSFEICIVHFYYQASRNAFAGGRSVLAVGYRCFRADCNGIIMNAYRRDQPAIAKGAPGRNWGSVPFNGISIRTVALKPPVGIIFDWPIRSDVRIFCQHASVRCCSGGRASFKTVAILHSEYVNQVTTYVVNLNQQMSRLSLKLYETFTLQK